MDQIDKLAELFEHFPGIGPRQAQRFVQFLLHSSSSYRRELADSIQKVGTSVSQCTSCMRFHARSDRKNGASECSICADPKRDRHVLAVVAHDSDLSALERSERYRGLYFVLGGTVPLAANKTSRLRGIELQKLVERRMTDGLSEIILALPANPEGDVTADHVRDLVHDLVAGKNVQLTSLGRGLSTGSELEYADSETLRSALDNRR